MGQWQPLADRIPLDMRRLATQLRRMKDRSGLTVPALAARTAQSAEVWEKAFSGRELPPLDAVEVLAQASGADYDRIGALWQLAEKASNGTGDRGRGKPLPKPDPLDPLGASEGLPGRRKRVLLLATAGALAVAALIAVILTAGTSTGRAPGRQDAAPTATGQAGASAPGSAPGGKSKPTGGARGSAPGGTGAGSAGPGSTAGADRPVPAMGSLAPPSGAPRTGGTGSDPGRVVGSGEAPTVAPSGTAAGGGTATDQPSVSPSDSSGPPPPTTAPAPSSSPLCLKVIVLGICLG